MCPVAEADNLSLPHAHVAQTIRAFDRQEWNRCFEGDLESYDYLRAIEDSGLLGFEFRYCAIEHAGVMLAAAPAFFTKYALDTTVTGWAKTITSGIRHMFPNALALGLGCVGSPCTESVGVGFAPEVSIDQMPELLRGMTQALHSASRRSNSGLLAVKDVPAMSRSVWDSALRPLGYGTLPGLPSAVLDTTFANFDDYLASLSHATRKDMRRKLRASSAVRTERRTDVKDVIERMYSLYKDTLKRADMRFEELTPAYFENVLAYMPGRSFCTLYFEDDALVAFNLLLEDGSTLLDKFLCMDGARGRALNIYFLSWLHNVRYCIEHRLIRYLSGQAAYENKIRLGSRLEPTLMYFRHRNPLFSKILQTAAPLVVSDPSFVKAAE